MYGWICPWCGGHLDPGERCDCREYAELQEEKKEPVKIIVTMKKEQKKKTALPV